MNDSCEQYADLPFFLKAGDALLISQQLDLTLDQLRKMMPAGTKLLLLVDNDWLIKAPHDTVQIAKEKISIIENVRKKTLQKTAKLLSENNVKRLCLIEGLPPQTEMKITEEMKIHSIPVAVFKRKGSVSESDFMSDEDTEEFEKRLRELGYM